MADTFIIADAGGTTTQWRVVIKNEIQTFETMGFNAYTHSLDDLKASISQTPALKHQDLPLFFYSAGVETEQQKKEIKHALADTFSGRLEVESDLLGVARALCKHEEGTVCILGTGANACYYNGNEVSKIGASLGYVLGDEGSGAYLGKKLLTDVFRTHFNPEIISAFEAEFHLTAHEAIQRIYNAPRPNHFLASFAPFIHKMRHHPQIQLLLEDAFNAFFDAFFMYDEIEEKPFHFSGSIACHFAETLQKVAAQRKITLHQIVQSPLSALITYHQG